MVEKPERTRRIGRDDMITEVAEHLDHVISG